MYIAHVSHNINFFKLATWLANPWPGLFSARRSLPAQCVATWGQLNCKQTRSIKKLSPYISILYSPYAMPQLYSTLSKVSAMEHQAARSVWPMLLFLAGLCWDPSRRCLHVSAALHDLRLSQHWSILRSCINLALIRVSGRWKCMASMYINVNVIIQHTDVHLNLSQGGLIGILGTQDLRIMA